MKFGRYLDKEAVPEWRTKYLNYRYLKDILREAPLNVPERVESELFFSVLNSEFEKIERFYRQHEMDMIQKCNLLFSQVSSMPTSRLRKALLHTYADLDLIRSYRSLNLQAFFKICKKYDKVTQSGNGNKYYEMVKANAMWSSPILDELSAKVEGTFQTIFAGGDRHKAMHQLRLKDLKHRHFHGAALTAGFLWGACGVLLWNIISNCLESERQRTLALLFAGQALPLALAGLFFVNVLGYNAAFINYRFIFGFEQRSAIHECQYLAMIGGFAFIFILSAYLVLQYTLHSIFALFPLLITLTVSTMPLPFLWPSSRAWMAKIAARLIGASLFPVRFADFFVADEMCSLTVTWQCLAWTLLYCWNSKKYSQLPVDSGLFFILPLIPFTIRFLQCLRRFYDTGIKFNLLNAFKYSLSIAAFACRSVSCWTLSETSWLFSLADLFTAMAGIFSLYWDLVMDFGLLQSKEWRKFMLRSQLSFSPRIIYYLIIVYDCLARIVFVWPLFLRLTDAPKPSYLLLIWAVIEVFRRFLWNFLRLEYEHLNNCDAFRALHDLDLPQIRTADLYYRVEDETEPAAAEEAEEEGEEEEFEESEVFNKKE